MKKIKIFIVTAVMLVVSSFVGTTPAKAFIGPLLCDFYTVTCFSNGSSHDIMICAVSAEALQRAKVAAINSICAVQN